MNNKMLANVATIFLLVSCSNEVSDFSYLTQRKSTLVKQSMVMRLKTLTDGSKILRVKNLRTGLRDKINLLNNLLAKINIKNQLITI